MSQHLEIPESVARQLAIFRRGLWLAETLAAVFGAVAGIFGAYLVLFVSDRVWDTPAWLRVMLTAGCLAAVAAWTWFWVKRWALHPRDLRQLAKMVQRHFPKLGDRLLGIVELAHPDTRPEGVSENLCLAAMRQVAAETESLDFARAVPKRQEHRWAVTFGALAVVALLALALLPLAGVNVWQRLLNPFGRAQRYTLAKLTGLPADQVVPYGEPFVVQAGIVAKSEWVPQSARGRYDRQPALDAPAVNQQFTFNVPGQTAAGTFTVRAGDAIEAVRVEPLHRPELLQLRALVHLPDYLGYPSVTQDVRRGTLEVPAHSSYELMGTASRPLATINGQTAGIAGTQFRLPAHEVKTPETLSFQWADDHGLSAKAPFKLKLNITEDQPPTVECLGLKRIVAMLEDETLEFTVSAADDYGVQTVGISWSGMGNEAAGVATAKGETTVAKGDQRQRNLTGPVLFSPRVHQIGPQRLELRATATDYKPGRTPATSQPHLIVILDKTEHAKLVQQEFDRLLEKLEELRRLEESLLERNEQLRRELEKSRAAGENKEKLAEQEQAERRNAAELKKVADDLAKLSKEALRNSQINSEIVAMWARLSQMLGQTATSGMPQVAQSLGQSSQSSSQSEQKGKMEEALKQQEQVLKELTAALQEMNKAGEMMQAGNFVARLRKMAGLQDAIGKSIADLLPLTIGARLEQLDASLRLKVEHTLNQQNLAVDSAKTVRDELGAFVTRTQLARYQVVHREMVDKVVVEELTRLAALLETKVSKEGADGARDWSAQFTAWAEMLQPPQRGGGGGAGGAGGGNEMDPEVMAAIMKLMRVRLAEEDLRNNTRALNQRTQVPEYPKQATGLSTRQTQLREETAEIGKVLRSVPHMPELLSAVDKAMLDAASLLAKPKTDGPTIAAQTEVIEILSAMMDQASQGASAAAGMMAMMQAMQPGQGKQPGKSPGQNAAGGTTERENLAMSGNPAGSPNDPRNVDKGTGRTLLKVPAEFRDAVQAYYEKVDKW